MLSKRIIPLLAVSLLALSGTSFATGIVVSPSAAPAANSTVVKDPVCDPDVFDRMKEKARMEAERETYVNQTLILKPDSLFALTCFSQQLGQTKANLGIPINNNTTAFDNAVNSVAGNSAAFAGPVDANGKILLTPDKSKVGTASTTTTDSKYEASPNKNTPFKCNEMAKLWQQAQCANFLSGDLPSLQETGDAGKEKRNYPQACTGGKDDTVDTDYSFANGFTNIYAPKANLPNVPDTDLKICQTGPYSQVSTITACKQPDGEYCYPSKKLTGQKITIGSTTYDAIDSCSNPGCSIQVSGGVLKCKQTK